MLRMTLSASFSALFRRENHGDGLSFQSSRALNFADIRQRLRHPVEHGLSELRMRDLTAAEHHRDLHLVLLFEKPPRVPRLGVEVVIVDAGTVLHFLELD